jgi:hypothetical protein
MAQIFISYSHAEIDTQHAARLARALEDYGHKVWWDRHLLSGDEFQGVIERYLSKAEAIIVIWSPRSVASDWVIAEASIGAQRKCLLPVRFERGFKLPELLKALHVEDLSEWDGEPRTSVMAALNARIQEFKTASDLRHVGDALGPKLKVRVEESSMLKAVANSALPGGLRVVRLAGGALVSASALWGLQYVANLPNEDNPAGLGAFLGFFLAVGFARVLDQIILAAKGLSCDRFFDRAFSFSSIGSALLGALVTLAATLSSSLEGEPPSFDIFANMLVMLTVGILVAGYVVRALITAGRVLQSRV